MTPTPTPTSTLLGRFTDESLLRYIITKRLSFPRTRTIDAAGRQTDIPIIPPLLQITESNTQDTSTSTSTGERTRTRHITYNLHLGQLDAWDSPARFVLILAGTQAGKTAFTPLWLSREINKQPPCLQEGDADYLVASATYDLLDLKLRPAMQYYFCELTNWGTYKAARNIIESNHDKSRIIFRSAENPDSLESATAPAAVLDEFGQSRVPVEAWEAIQRRLSLNRGRALICSTPYTLGWLKQQVHDRAIGGDPDYQEINFPSILNPIFSIEEYIRAKNTLPDWKFQMFYNGRFARPAGLIYSDFIDSFPLPSDGTRNPANTPHGNLVKPFKIPKQWPRYVGADFGGTEHTALLWIAEELDDERDGSPTGIYYVYRERKGGGIPGIEMAMRALEYNENVQRWTGGAKSEEDERMNWRQAGIPISLPFISGVEAGIERCIALFKTKRLLIFDTLIKLRSELGSYSRELDDSGSPTMRIENKEKFHLLDALRYNCSALPILEPIRPPSPRVRGMRSKEYLKEAFAEEILQRSIRNGGAMEGFSIL